MGHPNDDALVRYLAKECDSCVWLDVAKDTKQKPLRGVDEELYFAQKPVFVAAVPGIRPLKRQRKQRSERDLPIGGSKPGLLD
jgi:hypothetical protein